MAHRTMDENRRLQPLGVDHDGVGQLYEQAFTTNYDSKRIERQLFIPDNLYSYYSLIFRHISSCLASTLLYHIFVEHDDPTHEVTCRLHDNGYQTRKICLLQSFETFPEYPQIYRVNKLQTFRLS